MDYVGVLVILLVVIFAIPLRRYFVWQSRYKASQDRFKRLEEQFNRLQETIHQVAQRVEELQAGKRKPAKAREAVKAEAVEQPKHVVKSEPLLPSFPRAGAETPTSKEPEAKPVPEHEIAQLVEPVEKISESAEPLEAEPEPVPEAPTSIEAVAAMARNLEEKITANWLVWIGGIALALAGIFLIRYAAEQGWLSPAMRCIIGVAFGAGLVVAGEAVRRRPLERAIAAIKPDYVPQALTAAGLFTAFGSIYLAYAFYALIPWALSFALLAAISFAAFALSLVQGQFVAALGLAGATVTPALVSTDNPTAWGFFTYLGVIALATMAVADRRRWWWLVQAALSVNFIWSIIWFSKLFAIGDIVPIGAISGVGALASLVLVHRALRKTDDQLDTDRFGLNADIVAWTGLAVAVTTIFLLALISEFAAAAHWVALAMAIAAVAIARFESRFDLILAIFCVLVLVAFGLNYLDGIAIDNLAERAFGWPAATIYLSERFSSFSLHALLMAIALFVGGVFALSSTKYPGIVSLATGAVPVILMTIGYAQFRNITGDSFWAMPAAGLLVAASLATAFVRRSELPTQYPQGVYVTVAVAASFLALTFLFDRIWLTIAYAILVVAIGVVSMRVDLAILRRLASFIAMIVVARLTVNPDMRGYELLHPLGMQWVTYGYLAPMAAFLGAARLFRRTRDDLMVTVLEGGALLFAIMLVSIEIRIFMTGTIYSGSYKLPEMSLQTIAWLTSALILAYRHSRYPRLFSLWGTRILTLAGSAQALVLQLILYNPIFTGEIIQGYGVFNLLILSLLAPAALLWLIASYFGPMVPQTFMKTPAPSIVLRAMSMLLAFAFITEEMRVFFQGMVITPQHTSLLELYVTTLFWLAPATLPFAVGRPDDLGTVRAGALALIAVSVAMIVFGHSWAYNPAITGEPVRGWPIFNTLLLGFFLPAAILAWLSPYVEAPLRPLVIGACYFLLFVGLWLIVKQGFEGTWLAVMHQSLLELYTTTLIWLALAALPLFIRRAGTLEVAKESGLAVLAVSVLMLFLGHSGVFNPVFDGSVVRGWPVFNMLLLGFIAPAIVLAMIGRAIRSPLKPWLEGAAYLLLFIGITLLVKQAFQGAVLTPEILSEREDYGYSAAWIALALATMIAGIMWDYSEVRYAALAVLVLAVLKVFLFDMSGMGGLWRVASFLGLGLSLIGIGWIYQRFVYSRDAEAPVQAPTA